MHDLDSIGVRTETGDATEIPWWAWTIAFFSGVAALLLGLTNESLWHDEAFTEAMTRHSLWEIVELCQQDNNTPLYYSALRWYRSLLGDSVFVLRSFSILAGIGLAALGAGPIRRALGSRTGFLFVIYSITTPNLLAHCREARAFGWAAFFVTGAVVYTYLAVWGGEKSRRSYDWFKMTLFLVGACYIHAFALLAAVLTMLIAAVDCLVFQQRRIRRLLVVFAVVCIAYLPWAGVTLSRAATVARDFWIDPVGATKFLGVLIYPYLRKFEFHFMAVPAALVSFSAGLIAVAGAWNLRRGQGRCVLYLVLVYLLTITAAILISLVLRPILEYRYIIPLTGLSIAVVAYGMSRLGTRVCVGLAASLVILNLPAIAFQYVNATHGPMADVKLYLDEKLVPGDLIVHFDEATAGTFHYYFPDQPQCVYISADSKFYSNMDVYRPTIRPVHESESMLLERGRLWLVQMDKGFNARIARQFRSRLPRPGELVKSFSSDQSWYKLQLELIQLP